MAEVEIKQLSGKMDIDSPNETKPPVCHSDARNIIFRGPRGNMRAEVIEGSTEIVCPLLPDGVNKTINSTYDPVNQLIFFFNYNSLGTHGIYYYDTQAFAFTTLIQIGSSTDGDILGFTADLITSVNIEYRESSDGNLLYYVDTLGRPTCFNVKRYSAVTPPYAPIKRAYIDLAKAPPVMSPQVSYENDNTSTVNNFLNALFQYKGRFQFDDSQKSVLSTGSRVAIPTLPFDQVHDADPTKDSRMSIYMPTGDADVLVLEIWGKRFYDGSESDYFLITTLNKANLGIPDNDVYRYIFKNDGIYQAGDIQVTGQLQDWVPQKCSTQELLNGNVPVLGDITQGYDLVIPGMNFNITQVVPPSEVSGMLFFGSQGGVNSGGNGAILKLILTGAGANDGGNNPAGLPNFHGSMNVNCSDLSGADLSFTTGITAHATIPAWFAALSAAAIGKGFTVVSSSGTVLTLSYSSGFILSSAYTINDPSGFGGSLENQVSFAYADQSGEQFGIQYFDEKGRTNGTSLATVSTCKTPVDVTGNTTSQIAIGITSRPPEWAHYWDLMRLNKPTYNKRLFWVSNQTFTNVDLNTGVTYAYIGFTYMFEYDQNINAATPVVKYDFSPGDRIKFQIRYANDKTPNNMPPNLDFEIVSVAIDPFLNGIQQIGSFIKIVYPPSSIISASFDFGGPDQQWYKILLYSYKKTIHIAGEETFYEFNRRYGIGNPGTANCYHLGQTQSQTSDLVQPAIVFTMDGDYFYRFRNVPVGAIYYPTTGSVRYDDRYANIPVNIPGGAVVNTQYELQNVLFTSSSTNLQTFGSPNYLFYNKQTTPVTVRIRGKYPVTAEQPLTHQMLFKICPSGGPDTYFYAVRNKALSLTAVAGGSGTAYEFEFDAFIPVPANAVIFIVSQSDSVTGVATINVGAFDSFQFSIQDNIYIPIIEDSYSDSYNIVTNSNSRPSVYDENAKQQTDGALYSWGLADQIDTNINQANNFRFENSDRVDSSYGSIVRFRSRKRELRIFQERRTGRTGIYSRYLQNNDGSPNVVTTDTIITANNISYYEGEYGIGNQPASLSSAGFADYFVDPVKGFLLRLSESGVDPISEQNQVQTWAGENLPNYLSPYTYQFGGNAKVLGCVWFCSDRPTETLFVVQGGSNGTTSIIGEIFSFREDGNAFTSFYDINPDSVVCAENQLYYFHNGRMFIINNKTTYANFNGTQFKPSITLVFNDKIAIKKTFLSIAYQSLNFWTSDNVGDILTSQPNPQTGLPQISNLIQEDYDIEEGLYYAAFMRDANSMTSQTLALNEGDILKGVWVQVKMSFNGSTFITMYAPYISYIQSSRNL